MVVLSALISCKDRGKVVFGVVMLSEHSVELVFHEHYGEVAFVELVFSELVFG